MENKKAIVIGAGISGLTSALKLKDKGFDVVVLEKLSRAGGVIDTFEKDGFKAESGSNSVMIQSQKTLDFLDRIGAKAKMEVSNPIAKKRFFVKYGKPQAVPMSPFSLLFTPLFSFFGKIRLLCEPFVKKIQADDPSMAEFIKHRFGNDVLDYAINPFMAGVYGGDPEKLSAKHAFPPFWNLERKYGSIIRGAIKSMKEKRATGNFFKPMMISFKGGMKTLPESIAKALGDSIKCDAKIISIDFSGEGWQVQWATKNEEVCENYDALVIAIPAPEIEKLPLAGSLASELKFLEKIKYAPVATFTTGFERDQIAHKLDGFGALTPAKEDFKILGSLFVSSIFSERAKDGCATLTNYIGGMRYPNLASLPEDEMKKIVLADIEKMLGVKGEPIFQKMFFWKHAIPQYNVGYGEILDAIDEFERKFPNIALVGAYRGGVGVSSCLESALSTASKLADRITQ